MTVTLAEIEQQAPSLSPDERAHLVEILLEALQEAQSAEITAAWEAEIEERVAAFDRGEGTTHSAEEVISEARHLRAIERAAEGEEIVIARAGKPVARLVGLNNDRSPRVPGSMQGRIRIADDFDAPLPPEVSAGF